MLGLFCARKGCWRDGVRVTSQKCSTRLLYRVPLMVGALLGFVHMMGMFVHPTFVEECRISKDFSTRRDVRASLLIKKQAGFPGSGR